MDYAWAGALPNAMCVVYKADYELYLDIEKAGGDVLVTRGLVFLPANSEALLRLSFAVRDAGGVFQQSVRLGAEVAKVWPMSPKTEYALEEEECTR